MIGPRHALPISSSEISAENRALHNALASLANGKDSGEESIKLQSEGASEGGQDSAAEANQAVMNAQVLLPAGTGLGCNSGSGAAALRSSGSVGGARGGGDESDVVMRTDSVTSGVGHGVSGANKQELSAADGGDEAEGGASPTFPANTNGEESLINIPLLQQMQSFAMQEMQEQRTAVALRSFRHRRHHDPSEPCRECESYGETVDRQLAQKRRDEIARAKEQKASRPEGTPS